MRRERGNTTIGEPLSEGCHSVSLLSEETVERICGDMGSESWDEWGTMCGTRRERVSCIRSFQGTCVVEW